MQEIEYTSEPKKRSQKKNNERQKTFCKVEHVSLAVEGL
jgi:hypothetical protein